MRRSPYWGLAVVAAVVAVVVVVAILSRSTGGSTPDAGPSSPAATDSSSPTPTPTPTPDPVPTPAPSATTLDKGAPADDLVAPYVAAGSAARQNPSQPLELDQVATGDALDDLNIQVEELTQGGLSQVGSPTVVSAEVTASDPTADPPTATVLACLDYASVDVVNDAGQSAKDTAAPQRVATILDLVEKDGTWLVSKRTFPDDPTC
jgi:hypothetical protein